MKRYQIVFVLFFAAFVSGFLPGSCKNSGKAPSDVADAALQPPKEFPQPPTNLERLVQDFEEKIPGENTEGFLQPSDDDIESFEAVIAAMLAGRIELAQNLARPLGYEILSFREPDQSARYFMAHEAPSAPKRGSGLYIVNPDFKRPLVISVPHPLFDHGTPGEGVKVFEASRSRAFFLAGAHRCANSRDLPSRLQPSKTRACGGSLKVSDAAHNDRTFFQAAHQAVPKLINPPVVIELHAKFEPFPALVVSNGTSEVHVSSSLTEKLVKALRSQGVETQSCNEPHGESEAKPTLCGTKNVQGIVLKGRFVHIEQNAQIIKSPGALIKALEDTF